MVRSASDSKCKSPSYLCKKDQIKSTMCLRTMDTFASNVLLLESAHSEVCFPGKESGFYWDTFQIAPCQSNLVLSPLYTLKAPCSYPNSPNIPLHPDTFLMLTNKLNLSQTMHYISTYMHALCTSFPHITWKTEARRNENILISITIQGTLQI